MLSLPEGSKKDHTDSESREARDSDAFLAAPGFGDKRNPQFFGASRRTCYEKKISLRRGLGLLRTYYYIYTMDKFRL
jgi:hypothetical protein